MFINPGTPILVENPTYTGVLTFLKSQPCELVGISTDGSGIIPEELERVLSEWPTDQKPRPQVLYTVPTGGNPTGKIIIFIKK